MIIDLGINSVVLERDSPKVLFNLPTGRKVRDETVTKAGKCINDKKAIALVFLMVDDTKRAFQICHDVSYHKYCPVLCIYKILMFFLVLD